MACHLSRGYLLCKLDPFMYSKQFISLFIKFFCKEALARSPEVEALQTCSVSVSLHNQLNLVLLEESH